METKPTVTVHDDRIEIHSPNWELLAEMLRLHIGDASFELDAPEAVEGRGLRWDDEETVLYDADIAFLDPEAIGILRVSISENEIAYLNEGMQSKQYEGVYDRGVDFLVDLNPMASCLDKDDALKWAVFFEGLAAKLRSDSPDPFGIRPVPFTPKENK